MQGNLANVGTRTYDNVRHYWEPMVSPGNHRA